MSDAKYRAEKYAAQYARIPHDTRIQLHRNDMDIWEGWATPSVNGHLRALEIEIRDLIEGLV